MTRGTTVTRVRFEGGALDVAFIDDGDDGCPAGRLEFTGCLGFFFLYTEMCIPDLHRLSL